MFSKATKRAKKNAKRNAKRMMLPLLEADKISKQGIPAFENEKVPKPSQLGGGCPDRLTTADAAAVNGRDMAVEKTKSSPQSSPAAISGSQRDEGEWQEIMISMPPKENLNVFGYCHSSSDSDQAAQEEMMKSSEYVQKDVVVKAISATGQDMKLDVSSTGTTIPEAAELFEQKFLEQCSIAPETQAPINSSKEGFQPVVAFAAEIVVRLPPPGSLKAGQPQKKIATTTQDAIIKKPKKVRKAPHPNCTKPQVWLADESITMPMPYYPEPWVAPPPPPAQAPKRPVLTDMAKTFLLAQSPNCKISVHLVDDYGFTSFSVPLRGPEGRTLVPEYLVSTATLRAMGFYMGAAERIWERYVRNAENLSMEDEYTLLFYTQRFIEDTYTEYATVSGGEPSERGGGARAAAAAVTTRDDSDILMENWGLVCELRAAIRREARAKDRLNSWRPIIKITDLKLLKAQVTKKVSGKFRALDRLSWEIEERGTSSLSKKAVSLTPIGDYVEENKGKAGGMKFRANNQSAEVFAPLAKMLDSY